MSLGKSEHRAPLARPAIVVTAALLGCLIAVLLGTPRLWQAEVRWRQASRSSHARTNAPLPVSGPKLLAMAPPLPSKSDFSPPPSPPSMRVDRSTSPSDAVTLMIAMDETGKIFADGEPQTPGDLRAILHAVNFASDDVITAVLAVDPQCPHESVATVKEICEDEGAEVVQIYESAISAELILPPTLDPAVDTTDSNA